jgi:fumarylacetoacetase
MTMDYEAELGIFISHAVPAGKIITADEAEEHIFGFVILNDWSARDIQISEMNPLGPFNGKAFATSISPWVTPLEALESARCSSSCVDLRNGGSAGAPHLSHDKAESTWDIEFEVSVNRKAEATQGIKHLSANHACRKQVWRERYYPNDLLESPRSSLVPWPDGCAACFVRLRLKHG